MKQITRIAIITIILALFGHSTYAQTDSITFKPSGKIIARGFFDYSSGFGEKNNESGFDITRALLGYNYKFTKSLQAQVVIDGASGRNDKGNLVPYLRNAFVKWEENKFAISGGLVGTLQFKVQEEIWGHRYLFKSYQDEYKMGSSVDAGLTASYTFSPSISADASILNGEGYKKVEKNNSTRYGLGITAKPMNNIYLRIYGERYNDGEDLRDELPADVTDVKYNDQYNLALFAGYKNNKLSAGIEYNRMFNKGFINNKDFYGYSAYTTMKLTPKCNVYARYDWMNSSSPASLGNSWNSFDGQLMLIGVEFQLAKQLKISPNFRNLNTNANKSEQYLFVNLEFNI